MRLSLPTIIQSAKAIAKDFLESPKWPKRPQHLAFEITGACDAKCIHCPRQGMDRPKRQMNFELFKKMVDQAAEMRIPDLVPNGYGEILLINNLEDYLGYIRSKRHPFRILVNTNGYRMTDEKIELFFRYKVRLLNITIDGATAETAQAVRIGLVTHQIEDNIHRLLAQRKARRLNYPKIRVGMVLIPQNRHEGLAFLNKWRGVADQVGLGGFSSRLESVDAMPAANGTPHEVHPCLLPFRELNIWSDGKAVLCCEDWNEENLVGDLNIQSLKEIWHGVALRHARHLHKIGQGHRIPICSKCNIWRKPSAGARLWS